MYDIEVRAAADATLIFTVTECWQAPWGLAMPPASCRLSSWNC